MRKCVGVGYRSGKSCFWLCPSTFWALKVVSRFGERFRDGQYSLVSFLFAVLLLAVPPCPAICKGGHVPPVPYGVSTIVPASPLRHSLHSPARVLWCLRQLTTLVLRLFVVPVPKVDQCMLVIDVGTRNDSHISGRRHFRVEGCAHRFMLTSCLDASRRVTLRGE